MTITSLPDFSGDGQVHSIASLIASAGVTLPGNAAMLLIREISGGAANSRVGGSNVATNRGIPLSTADSLLLPGFSAGGSLDSLGWDVSVIYIYAATGDTLSISFAGF
jgi:hypothetical protein